MPTNNTTRQQQHSFRLFQRRQAQMEKRYEKHFFKYLRKTYNDAARFYKENGHFDFGQISNPQQLEKIFRSLYTNITLNEAKTAYKEFVEPLEGESRLKTKDIISDLVEIMSPNNRGLINMWQSLLDNFLTVRLTNRITMINNTTNERISRVIEDSIFEGLGAEETARRIRKEASSNLNRQRSRAIARTETMTAGNQGRYMAAQSSSLKMEKKWHAATDARTRHSHRAMNDVKWTDLDKYFWVANSLGILERAMHPLDEELSASNCINCRCSLTFRAKRDSDGNLIRKS